MKLGVFDLLSLATTLIFAVPVANFGITRLLAGEYIGGAALVLIAVAMVVLPQYFFDPKKLVVGLLPDRLRSTSSTDAEADASAEREKPP